jgi:GT2 family glycosyltransferase
MTLHIVVPVHNRVAVTLRFVEALRAQTFGDFVLVLVDDGSTDGTADAVQGGIEAARLMVLRGDGSLWWAGALQLAYEYLGSLTLGPEDAVLLINDDVHFGADFLSSGMALLALHPSACIQAASLDLATGAVARGVVVDIRQLLFRTAAVGEPPNCLATRGLLMRAQTFTQSGGFRPGWLPHYLSDYEFTIRLHRRGVPLLCVDAFSAEFDSTTTGDNAYPDRVSMREFLTRAFSNRAKFNPKHWSAFVVMVCPYSAMPAHLVRIWWHFVRGLVRSALRRPVQPG